MKKTAFVTLVSSLCVFLGSPPAAAAAQPDKVTKPNILFVIADQWRAQAFGFAGDPNVKTPHLDALQKSSIDCVNAISGVPVCSPARAALMTGQRPLTHGVFLNDVSLNLQAVTIAKVLAQAGYYANCTALEDCVGELLKTLRETGLASNTIVVFTADHGDLLGSHAGFNKQQPYDESIRVPLLLHWPKGFGTSGRSLDALINSEDMMPTLLGLCDVPVPKTVEGINFSDYLQGGKNPADNATVIASPTPFGQWERRFGGREFRGVRTPRYTYVRDLNGPWLLFDNQTDPYQQTNLANQPEQAALQAKLEAMLNRKLKENGNEFLPATDYIQQYGYQVNINGTVRYTS